MRTEGSADLISVIVPVYNMEKYLGRCMASIQAQTYGDLEIILVDDGSTDRSPQMCDGYAQTDARVKVVHKQNGGLSDARNAGLRVATGAYIGYVDSDDWIEPDMYERMYRACAKTGAELAACRYVDEYTAEGMAVQDSPSLGSGEVVPLSREELLKIYICGHDKYNIRNSVWSKLFRRDLVQGVLFPKGKNSEDIMYTTRAFCALKKAVYVDKSLYHYVIDREGSIMNGIKGERMFQDEIPFWREHIAHIRRSVSDDMGDLAAYHFYKRLLAYYLRACSDRRARKDAQRLEAMMRNEAGEIRRVYAGVRGRRGDTVRMSVFLRSPLLYRIADGLYGHVLVPVKRKMR